MTLEGSQLEKAIEPFRQRPIRPEEFRLMGGVLIDIAYGNHLARRRFGLTVKADKNPEGIRWQRGDYSYSLHTQDRRLFDFHVMKAVVHEGELDMTPVDFFRFGDDPQLPEGLGHVLHFGKPLVEVSSVRLINAARSQATARADGLDIRRLHPSKGDLRLFRRSLFSIATKPQKAKLKPFSGVKMSDK